MMIQFFLACGLVICGFFLGWQLRPWLFEMMIQQECECGSGKKYKNCCLDIHIQEGLKDDDN